MATTAKNVASPPSEMTTPITSQKKNSHIFYRDTCGASYIGSGANVGGAWILLRQDLARINPSIAGCCMYLWAVCIYDKQEGHLDHEDFSILKSCTVILQSANLKGFQPV